MPCALMAAILEREPLQSGVDVVETRYAVPEWGVGELWSRDGVVLAHDFRFGSTGNGWPRVHRRARGRFEAFLAGEAVDFDDVELDLEWTTPFQRSTSPTRYAPCRAARS